MTRIVVRILTRIVTRIETRIVTRIVTRRRVQPDVRHTVGYPAEKGLGEPYMGVFLYLAEKGQAHTHTRTHTHTHTAARLRAVAGGSCEARRVSQAGDGRRARGGYATRRQCD